MTQSPFKAKKEAQRSVSSYERKLEELKAELVRITREVDDQEGKIDRAKSGVASLEKRKTELVEEIGMLSGTVSSLDLVIKNRNAERDRIKEMMADEIGLHESIIASLENRKRRTINELSAAKGSLEKTKGAKEDLAKIEEAITEAEKKLARTIEANESARRDILKEKQDVRKEREEFEERRRKINALAVETEKRMRLLEHYVKRLQRRYDKTGVKVDILSQFGVRRDNK